MSPRSRAPGPSETHFSFFSDPSVLPHPDRLNVPSVLVLSGCGISRAGEQAEIAAFCAHVMELDLSHNKLQDWHQVSAALSCLPVSAQLLLNDANCLQISKIVSSIPNLEFLNLSSNPLGGLTLDPQCAGAFSRVRRFVLNNTQVSWETVLLLTREMPE